MRNVSRILIVVIGALLFYAVYFLVSHKDRVDVVSPVSEDAAEKDLTDKTVAESRPYSDYVRAAPGRDIFISAPDTPAEQKGAVDVKGSNAQHRIVGLLIGKNSEVAIENTGQQKTYFIQEGQTEDGVSFQRVENGQIWLSYQGKTFSVKAKDGRVDF